MDVWSREQVEVRLFRLGQKLQMWTLCSTEHAAGGEYQLQPNL